MTADVHAAAEQGIDLFNSAFLHSQVFWTGVAFFLMMAIMAWKVLPAITAMLDERAEKIRNDLDSAENKHAEAEKVLADYEAKLSKAKDETHALLNQARQEVKDLRDARMAELEEELKHRREEATKALDAAKVQAMKELQAQVATLVVDVTGQLINETVDAKKAEKLTDAAVKSLVN